jgi:PEP-CTERM motif
MFMRIKQLVFAVIVVLSTGLTTAYASLQVTLFNGTTQSGDLVDYPGTTVGWGIGLVNQSPDYWAQIGGTALTWYGGTDTVDGTYSDILGATMFPVDGTDYTLTLAPNASYLSYYAPLTQTGGVGNVVIKNGLAQGIGGTYTLGVSYTYYTQDPRGLADPGTFTAPEGLGLQDSANASVTTIPEPTTYALLCLSLGVIGYARRKMTLSVG